jgi:hypothetical protein
MIRPIPPMRKKLRGARSPPQHEAVPALIGPAPGDVPSRSERFMGIDRRERRPLPAPRGRIPGPRTAKSYRGQAGSYTVHELL